MNDLGLYLHIPFCLRKCPYCSFYSLAGRTDVHHRYVKAVSRQLRSFEEKYYDLARPVSSIFFGGGTPTLLPLEALVRFLGDCLDRFPCTDATEISIEVNPATVDFSDLHQLRQAGFNRLSIGVQSLNDAELCRLGRSHTVADAMQTVCQARQAGFDNINLDLMYGLPGQDRHTWQTTLDKALALETEHLSIYELTIEPGTLFARQQEQEGLSLPDEDTVLVMLEQTQLALNRVGLQRYEISNYARSGHQCRHNINYWRNGEYIGMGAGAVAFLNGIRCTAITDVDQFCRCIENEQEIWEEQEKLSRDRAFRETVIMGLRMITGVSLGELTDRFGIKVESYYSEILHRLTQQGMVHIVQDRLQLTDKGLLLANTVMAELV